MPFGPLGIPAVAHRLLYRREDRANPEIIAFVDWITALLAQERHSEWHRSASMLMTRAAPDG